MLWHRLQKIFLLMSVTLFIPHTILANIKNLDATGGQLDLKNFSQKTAYRLGGQWFFYPDAVVHPQDFLKSPKEWMARARTIQVGSGFNDGQEPLMKSGQGFATYLLQLDNVPELEMAIWGWSAFTSARLYVFSEDGQGSDRPLLELGRFAEQPADNLPQIANEEIGVFLPQAPRT